MRSSPTLLSALTTDGVRLCIEHFSRQADARGAVVLQHGLGSNRAVYVTRPHHFAEHLAREGFDVYVSELRGAGRSQKPRAGFSLDDYLERDLPAVIDTVLAHSGRDRLSWVGHSLGGVMMMMYGIEHPDAPIERLVAVGSSLDYKPGRNFYRELLKLQPLMGMVPALPFGKLAALNAPLAGRGPLLTAERINFFRRNIDRKVMRHVLRRGFCTIPMPLLESLASTFGPAGFARDSGRVVYLERAHGFRVPTLLLGGSRDPQCPPEAVAVTEGYLSGAPVKRMIFGREYGQVEEYGHFDLILGERAAHEVWPYITHFLAPDGESISSEAPSARTDAGATQGTAVL